MRFPPYRCSRHVSLAPALLRVHSGTSCNCSGTSCNCSGTSCNCSGTSCNCSGTSCNCSGTSCNGSDPGAGAVESDQGRLFAAVTALVQGLRGWLALLCVLSSLLLFFSSSLLLPDHGISVPFSCRFCSGFPTGFASARNAYSFQISCSLPVSGTPGGL